MAIWISHFGKARKSNIERGTKEISMAGMSAKGEEPGKRLMFLRYQDITRNCPRKRKSRSTRHGKTK